MSTSGYNKPQKRRYMRRGIATGLVLVSALMLLADRQQKEMLASGRLTADDTSAKVMNVLATPIHGIEMLFKSIGDRTNAYRQNKFLTAEVDRLSNYENRVLDLELRLKAFEDMLEVDGGSNADLARVVARAVSETNGPFTHSALINVGQNKSIKQGHAVMTVNGLYGHVVRAGKSSARVLLLNDLNSHISVMSQRSGSRAIMIGNNTDQPRLDYISPEADWQAGDQVISSGDGGVLPAGLNIGYVQSDAPNDFRVRLQTQGKPIDWVWVYLFDAIEPPDQQVMEIPAPTVEGEAGTPTVSTEAVTAENIQ